jgi:hypothetical protein
VTGGKQRYLSGVNLLLIGKLRRGGYCWLIAGYADETALQLSLLGASLFVLRIFSFLVLNRLQEAARGSGVCRVGAKFRFAMPISQKEVHRIEHVIGQWISEAIHASAYQADPNQVPIDSEAWLGVPKVPANIFADGFEKFPCQPWANRW